MSKVHIEVELESNGSSQAGKERFKGQAILPDGRVAYVTVYGKAPEKAAEPKPPTVRKSSKSEAPAGEPGVDAKTAALIAQVVAAMKAAK